MSEPRWNLREILSRVMFGGTLGVFGLTLLAIALDLTATLLKTPPKGSWTTDVAIWMAIYGLPGSFVLGAVAGIFWQRGTAIHLSLIELIVYCLVVILCCFINSPLLKSYDEHEGRYGNWCRTSWWSSLAFWQSWALFGSWGIGW